METKRKYAKPDDFKGRGKGVPNYKKLRWEVLMYRDGEFLQGKFSSIPELNTKLGLQLTSCAIGRLISLKNVDQNRSRCDSFLERYKHIQIKRILEDRPQQ